MEGESRQKDHYQTLYWVPLVGILLPVLFVFIILFIFSKKLKSSKVNNEWVAHTEKAIALGNKIQKIAANMETGQRGYIITQQIEFLKPFNEEVDSFASEIEKTMSHVSDNPPQVEKIQEIKRLITHWLKVAGRPEIEAGRQNNFVLAQELLRKKT